MTSKPDRPLSAEALGELRELLAAGKLNMEPNGRLYTMKPEGFFTRTTYVGDLSALLDAAERVREIREAAGPFVSDSICIPYFGDEEADVDLFDAETGTRLATLPAKAFVRLAAAVKGEKT